MKTRILAFFLALVMLFSCLSLNIFAEEAVSTEATTEETQEIFHSDNEILNLIKEVNFFKDHEVFKEKYTYESTPSKIPTSNNKAGKITVSGNATDGYRYIYGAPYDHDGDSKTSFDGVSSSNSYINFVTHSGYSGRSIVTEYDGYAAKGKSFIVQLNIEFTDGIYNVVPPSEGTKFFPLFQVSSYLGNKGYNGSTNRLGTVGPDLVGLYITPGTIDEEKNLVAPGVVSLVAKDAGDTKEISILEPGVNYTIAAHIDPSVYDAENGIYGAYNIYLNGICVSENLSFLNSDQNKAMNFSETTPYFLDSAFTSDKFDKDEEKTAYFFTDNKTDEKKYNYTFNDDGTVKSLTITDGSDGKLDACQEDTDNDGIPDVYENITEKNKAKVTLTAKQAQLIKSEAIGTATDVRNYSLSFARFTPNTSWTFAGPAFYFDNLIVYYTDTIANAEYVDVTKHNYEIAAHTHNSAKGTVSVTYKCTVCDETYTQTEALDTNGDRACDICVSVGGKMTSEELIKAVGANNVIFTSNMSGLIAPRDIEKENTISYSYGSNPEYTFSTTNPNGNISIVTVNGNSYLKYGKSLNETGKFNDSNFFQVKRGTFTSMSNMAKHIDNQNPYVGAPYVISYDFTCLDYQGFNNTLLEVMSYISTSESYKTIALNFIGLGIDGELKYLDGAGENAENKGTGKFLDIGKSYNIAIHHRPKNNAYDLYIDGELVIANVTALSTNSLNLSCGTLYGTSTEVDGETQFTPAIIRFRPMHRAISYDVYEIDNINIYHSETYLECAHAWEHVHNISAKTATYTCTICGKTETAELFSDYSALTGSGNLLTPEELKATNVEIKTATELDVNSTGVTFKDNGVLRKVAHVVDDNGNGYFKYYNPSMVDNYNGNADDGKTSYLQTNITSSGSYAGTFSNFWEMRGKNMTYSFDFLYGDGFKDTVTNYINLIDIMSYLAGSKAANSNSIALSTFDIYPIQLDKDGYLYRSDDGANGKKFKLDINNWYNILIYHDVAKNTFDIFVNGECIWNDATALTTTQQNIIKWTYTEGDVAPKFGGDNAFPQAFINGISSTNDAGKKTYTLTPADFFPTYIRTAQVNSKSADTVIAYDNIKFYHSTTNIECTHECTTSNVCDLCGATLNVSTSCNTCGYLLADGVSVLKRNVTLGDKIGMNLYLTVSDSVLNTADAKIVVSAAGTVTEIPVSELTKEADGTYKVTASLRSIDMTKNVTVEVAGIDSIATYTTSVYEYLDALNKTTKSNTERALIVAMKNYGAYAQEYFAKNGTDVGNFLANRDLLSYVKSVGKAENPALNYRATVERNGESDIVFTGVSLVLSSETRMKLYFTASAGATVTVGGETVHKYQGEKDGEYYIILSRATPAALGDNFTVVITDGGTVTCTVSILSALDAVFVTAPSEQLVNLARAIYNYYAAAYAYAAK